MIRQDAKDAKKCIFVRPAFLGVLGVLAVQPFLSVTAAETDNGTISPMTRQEFGGAPPAALAGKRVVVFR